MIIFILQLVVNWEVFKIYFIFWKLLRVCSVRVKKFCPNRSKRHWTIVINPLFSTCRSSAIVCLWGKFPDDPLCTSHFYNREFWQFCAFGLKTPIYAHFWLFMSVKIGENEKFLNWYCSRNAITQNWRHMKQTM